MQGFPHTWVRPWLTQPAPNSGRCKEQQEQQEPVGTERLALAEPPSAPSKPLSPEDGGGQVVGPGAPFPG